VLPVQTDCECQRRKLLYLSDLMKNSEALGYRKNSSRTLRKCGVRCSSHLSGSNDFDPLKRKQAIGAGALLLCERMPWLAWRKWRR